MTTKLKTLWKSMPADMSPHNFHYEIGRWHEHKADLKICESGFHASKNVIDAMYYVNAGVIAQVQVRGRSVIQDDKECWSEMRIAKAWKWEKEDSVALAIFAAELVIDIYEKKYPNDDRPRKAIEAAKAYMNNPSDAANATYAAANAATYAAYTANAAYALKGVKEKCVKFVIVRLEKKTPIKK